MSQENVETVERAIAAFNASAILAGEGDPAPWLREFCDPAIELDLSRRGIDPDVYHGHAGFLRLRSQDSDAWHESRFDVEDILDAGDSVVLLTHNTGTARSGVKLGVRVAHVLTLRTGKIVRWEYFGEDRDAALKAAGLTE